MLTSRVPLQGLAAAAAAVVAGIGLFELAARIGLGPPAVHLLTRPARDVQTDFDITYAVDRNGRRRGCPPPAAPGRRVAIIGDSFAFGAGVGDLEHFAARLGCAMPGAEILNFGSIGHDFLYYEIALRSLVPGDTDDLILLLYDNDLPPADWERGWSRMKRTLYRTSHAVVVLRAAWQAFVRRLRRAEIESIVVDGRPNNVKVVALTNPGHFDSIAHPPPDRLALFDRALDRFVDRARRVAPRARIFVAVVPDASTLSRRHRAFFASLADVPLPPFGAPSPFYLRARAACAALAGCSFIELYEALSHEGESLYFPHDLHWTPRGHAVVAGVVRAALDGVERPHSTARD